MLVPRTPDEILAYRDGFRAGWAAYRDLPQRTDAIEQIIYDGFTYATSGNTIKSETKNAPSIGQIVWYRAGERNVPAIIINVQSNGDCHLYVIHPDHISWAGAKYDAEGAEGTWRWPERADGK